MEDFVLTIEQCKHLQELGLDMRDAKLCWIEDSDHTKRKVILRNSPYIKTTYEKSPSTYTFQELWNKIPSTIKIGGGYLYTKTLDDIAASYVDNEGHIYVSFWKHSMLENAYDLLCWVIEEEYLKF